MNNSTNTKIHNLLDGLEQDFYFVHILGISASQLTKSYFSEGFKPPTRIISPIINHGLMMVY